MHCRTQTANLPFAGTLFIHIQCYLVRLIASRHDKINFIALLSSIILNFQPTPAQRPNLNRPGLSALIPSCCSTTPCLRFVKQQVMKTIWHACVIHYCQDGEQKIRYEEPSHRPVSVRQAKATPPVPEACPAMAQGGFHGFLSKLQLQSARKWPRWHTARDSWPE